jgi:hypothetical protein
MVIMADCPELEAQWRGIATSRRYYCRIKKWLERGSKLNPPNGENI